MFGLVAHDGSYGEGRVVSDAVSDGALNSAQDASFAARVAPRFSLELLMLETLDMTRNLTCTRSSLGMTRPLPGPETPDTIPDGQWHQQSTRCVHWVLFPRVSVPPAGMDAMHGTERAVLCR